MAATYECAAGRAHGADAESGGSCAASWCRWPRCAAPGCALGRRPRRSRSSEATATWRTGPWPASSVTPSATPSGKAPRTSSVHRRPPGHAGRTGPPGPVLAGWSRPSRRAGGTRSSGPPSTRWRRPWPTPGRRRPTSRGPATTSPCCRAGGSPSSWPTPSEGALLVEEAAWALDRDGDARKAAVARRFASRPVDHPRTAGHHRPRPLWSSTSSSRSCATDRSAPTTAWLPQEVTTWGRNRPSRWRHDSKGSADSSTPPTDLGHPVEAGLQDAFDASLEGGRRDGARGAGPLELDLDGAGLDVDGEEGEVTAVTLDRRTHELDQLVQVTSIVWLRSSSVNSGIPLLCREQAIRRAAAVGGDGPPTGFQ
jgi:hypothetical protein